jgi:hypothetical protein
MHSSIAPAMLFKGFAADGREKRKNSEGNMNK